MKIVVIVVGLITLFAACSSSTKGSGQASPRGTVSAAVSSTAISLPPMPRPDLKSQLLTVADMPTGWSVDNSSNSDSGAPPCLKTVKAATNTSDKETVDFIRGSDVPVLTHSVGFYGTTSAAAQKFSSAGGLLDNCKDVSFDSGGTHYTGSLGTMSFPQYGDESRAWKMTISAGGQTAGFDVVLIHKGAELIELALGDYEPSTDDLQQFCTKAVAKLP